MIYYLSLEEVMIINSEVLDGEARLRDRGLLESALARPMASAFGDDAYPNLTDKAAALLHSLSHNHAFVDGNKRTATLATVLFLKKNNLRPAWKPSEALDFVLEVAQGQHKIVTIAAWLTENTEQLINS